MTHKTALQDCSAGCARAQRPGGYRGRHARLAYCLAMLLLWVCLPVRASSHALIMWIGRYAEPSAKLAGIEQDAQLAKEMAQRLGIPPENIMERSDAQLSFEGLRGALAGLTQRVHGGDRVFIYFSGHGARWTRAGAPGCRQGLVTYEGRLLLDALLRSELQDLAGKASQVVMFTDACHSGGVVDKEFDPAALRDDAQPKAYPAPLREEPAGPAATPAMPDACAAQINLSKSLDATGGVVPPHDDRIFHLAASAEDEAAFATPQGSLATRAWAACLATGAAYTGDALAHCAQHWIDSQRPLRRQTVTPRFNGRLWLTGGSR